MNTFHLQIVTPHGLMYDDEAVSIVVRTINGDVGIMKGHSAYMSPVNKGKIRVKSTDDVREAECDNGFISVTGEVTRLVTDGFRWI